MSESSQNKLFSFPDVLPSFVPEVPRLVVKRTSGRSPCDEQETLCERVQEAAECFDMSGEPMVDNERAVLRNGDRSLEVFAASDSLWWTDHARAYVDDPTAEACLPPADEAFERARKYMKRRGLDELIDLEHARPTNCSYSEAASGDCEKQLAAVRTSLDANFGWRVKDLPVFGPGAKLRVSFGHDDRVTQFVCFWREFEHDGEIALIKPERAIERFTCDPMFAQLCDADARIAVNDISLGYFALPPAEYQRSYVPVYRFEATAQTKAISKQAFRRYVLAAELSPRHSKRQRMVADPGRYFAL